MATFGIGIFSMTACVISRLSLILWQYTYNSNRNTFNLGYPIWMGREVSAAVIVGNLYYDYAPLIKAKESWISKFKARKAAYRQTESPDGTDILATRAALSVPTRFRNADGKSCRCGIQNRRSGEFNRASNRFLMKTSSPGIDLGLLAELNAITRSWSLDLSGID
ncbi:hypothetical protein H072_3623 [Dactylellina haptotyla CBS 200.50]|uniref:Uncharacterized protein n=1 Tax=Dactylellina haptotyla (strain CBS 200.50) TaxID=1284197 RepID=S8AHR1_DACHA|nr:hypothetical protein H072_3623 [Dactylellina haptotyla CBS 200.50]